MPMVAYKRTWKLGKHGVQRGEMADEARRKYTHFATNPYEGIAEYLYNNTGLYASWGLPSGVLRS